MIQFYKFTPIFLPHSHKEVKAFFVAPPTFPTLTKINTKELLAYGLQNPYYLSPFLFMYVFFTATWCHYS